MHEHILHDEPLDGLGLVLSGPNDLNALVYERLPRVRRLLLAIYGEPLQHMTHTSTMRFSRQREVDREIICTAK